VRLPGGIVYLSVQVLKLKSEINAPVQRRRSHGLRLRQSLVSAVHSRVDYYNLS